MLPLEERSVMMNPRDLEYYTMRERKERETAARTDDATAKIIHLEMAARYSARLTEFVRVNVVPN
jgi:hypothetical protein